MENAKVQNKKAKCKDFAKILGNYIPIDTRCSYMNKYREQDSRKNEQSFWVTARFFCLLISALIFKGVVKSITYYC